MEKIPGFNEDGENRTLLWDLRSRYCSNECPNWLNVGVVTTEEIAPAFRIPLELSVTVDPTLELHCKGEEKCAMMEKLACIEVFVQYTRGHSLVLCSSSCFFSPWGFAADKPTTWETVNDSSEHQLMLKYLLTPNWSPFLSIPRYQQSQ